MSTNRKRIYRSKLNEDDNSQSMNNPIANSITDPQLLKQYATIVNQKLNLTKQYDQQIDQLNRQLNQVLLQQAEKSNQIAQKQQETQQVQEEPATEQTGNLTDNL